mgnify:CR=1 FL=1
MFLAIRAFLIIFGITLAASIASFLGILESDVSPYTILIAAISNILVAANIFKANLCLKNVISVLQGLALGGGMISHLVLDNIPAAIGMVAIALVLHLFYWKIETREVNEKKRSQID